MQIRRQILSGTTASVLSLGAMTGGCAHPCGCGNGSAITPPSPHTMREFVPAVGDGEIFTDTASPTPSKPLPTPIPARTYPAAARESAVNWNTPRSDTQYKQESSPSAGYDADVAVDPAGQLLAFSSTARQ